MNLQGKSSRNKRTCPVFGWLGNLQAEAGGY
jgi:hypothetical protein